MAGKVLRNSKGQYAGSTRGWGKGRSAHGGGFGSTTKGKTKQLHSAEHTRARIHAGAAVGAYVASAALQRAALSGKLGSGRVGTAVKIATTAVAIGSGIYGKKSIKTAIRTR